MSSRLMDEFTYEGRVFRRHWNPDCEQYTGADALLTRLDLGWRVEGVVFCQEFWLGGSRRVCIYHVDLRRGSDKQRMMIQGNPFLMRFLQNMGVQLVLVNQRKDVRVERWR